MDRPTAIRKSLTTFVCGLIGCVPIIGLIPAVYAIVCWNQVRRRFGKEWNPASAYLDWGARLANLALLVTALLTLCAITAGLLVAF